MIRSIREALRLVHINVHINGAMKEGRDDVPMASAQMMFGSPGKEDTKRDKLDNRSVRLIIVNALPLEITTSN